MTDLAIREAQRASAKPLMGLYGESESGKTYTALLVARGFVGPTGRICMIETEAGRGESYAEPSEYPELAGTGSKNYDVIPLRDDFSPVRYGEAIGLVEKGKYDALIIDSGSHEWEGPGGVLAMADENSKSMKGVLIWQRPKLAHARHFMLKLMQTPIPLVILNMRAKYPMEEKQKPGGGKEWVRSTILEPKQSDDILYEMFVHGWIDRAHNFHLNRATSKSLAPVFSGDKPLTLETGRALAAWAKGGAPAAKAEPFNLQPPEDEGREAAEGGSHALRGWWERLPKDQRAKLEKFKDDVLKPIAAKADAQSNSQKAEGEQNENSGIESGEL